MTCAGCEWTCSLAPGGSVASSTRTRSFSNLTRVVLALTTAESCADAVPEPTTKETPRTTEPNSRWIDFIVASIACADGTQLLHGKLLAHSPRERRPAG